MESKLGRLSLDAGPEKSVTTPKSKGKAAVADAWDQESTSDSDTGAEDASSNHKLSVPNAPPPTPISPSAYPTWDSGPATQNAGYMSTSTRDRGQEEKRRPEKSTAAAGRLIAGALGVKAPKKTDEQRAYERAIKEQEIKRKNREKAAKEKEKEEVERAKSAVWDG
jgi:hypothetical protein